MAVEVEIVRRNEEEVARPAIRNGEDRDLRMRDQEVTQVSAILEESQHANTKATDSTPLVNVYSAI